MQKIKITPKSVSILNGAKPYMDIVNYIRVESKKEGLDRLAANKAIANLKKLKREIEAENASADEQRVIEIILTEKAGQELLANLYMEKNMESAFNETDSFINQLDELIKVYKSL